MKREDLRALSLTDEQIDAIMTMNGKDIEKHKSAAETARTELDGVKTQLSEANTAIEGFKKLDVDGIQQAADEWKTKAEQAQKDADAKVAALRFDHALDGALTGAKVKDPVAVRAHLKTDLLKLADDGSISGLGEQLDKLKSEHDFLFENATPAPAIVAGAQHSPTIMGDPVVDAMRKAAGLPPLGDKPK